ncbi:hypothetical protein D4R52_00280 [bacterium]|nr:MAG: hypothetical protein D4R52_00280 [bacterium]
MQTPITLILLGDIAAGKGTQAKLIVKKFGLHLVDVGAYTRRILTGRSKVGIRLSQTKIGKLAPSDIIQQYLKAEITKITPREGILLDGGKMPAEAKLIYRGLLSKKRKILVIYLKISRAETFRRLKWRYYCANTGRPLVIKNAEKKCPHCGGKIIKRADDDANAIKNRIDYYDKIYSKTVEFWKGLGLLKFVNGKQSAKDVTEDILKIIADYYQ